MVAVSPSVSWLGSVCSAGVGVMDRQAECLPVLTHKYIAPFYKSCSASFIEFNIVVQDDLERAIRSVSVTSLHHQAWLTLGF